MKYLLLALLIVSATAHADRICGNNGAPTDQYIQFVRDNVARCGKRSDGSYYSEITTAPLGAAQILSCGMPNSQNYEYKVMYKQRTATCGCVQRTMWNGHSKCTAYGMQYRMSLVKGPEPTDHEIKPVALTYTGYVPETIWDMPFYFDKEYKYIIYNQPGGGAYGNDVAACITYPGVKIQAYNKDSASPEPILGKIVSAGEGCSWAAYGSWTVRCCI